MSFGEFLKDRILMLVLQGICMTGLYGFLRLTGYGRGNCTLILLVWILILAAHILTSYVGRKRYFKEMKEILEHTDKRYLLGELMPDSWRQEDKIYRGFIRKSNKSVIEEIRQVQERQEEYKEYIETGFTKSRRPLQGFLLSVKMEEARKILQVEAFGKSLLRIRKLKIMWIWFFIMHVRKMFIRTI